MLLRKALVVGLLGFAVAEDGAAEPVGEIPAALDGAAFFEPFLANWEDTWKVSKDADFSGRWKLEDYIESNVIPGDQGLVVSDEARKHAVSTLFAQPFAPEKAGLVVQYELQLKNGLQCGGAYLKLLTASEALDHDGFKADTPYTVMFGPDKCGDTNKVHFILRHKSPKTGEWEEKHLVSPPVPIVDKAAHLYTAIVGTDNSVKILVDNKEVKSASLTSDADFKPSINPPKEVDDPTDAKPEDWVDEPKMEEPGAAKPDDWDEDAPTQIPDPSKSKPSDWLDDAPQMIPDGSAVRPDDWDEDEDGEWEAPLLANPDCKKYGCGEWKAPMIPNPAYKGKWSPPMIDNPDYVGIWSPRQIANPNYFEDDKPYAMAPIGGIGIELWTMQNGILFDNILVASNAAVASTLAQKTFAFRQAAAKAAQKGDVDREPGFLGSIKYYVKTAFYYAMENPVLIGVSLLLGIVPIVLLCCFLSSGDEPREPRAAPAAAGASDDDGGNGDDDQEDERVQDVTEEKEEDTAKGKKEKTPPASPKDKSAAKKRTAKAKD